MIFFLLIVHVSLYDRVLGVPDHMVGQRSLRRIRVYLLCQNLIWLYDGTLSGLELLPTVDWDNIKVKKVKYRKGVHRSWIDYYSDYIRIWDDVRAIVVPPYVVHPSYADAHVDPSYADAHVDQIPSAFHGLGLSHSDGYPFGGHYFGGSYFDQIPCASDAGPSSFADPPYASHSLDIDHPPYADPPFTLDQMPVTSDNMGHSHGGGSTFGGHDADLAGSSSPRSTPQMDVVATHPEISKRPRKTPVRFVDYIIGSPVKHVLKNMRRKGETKEEKMKEKTTKKK